MADVTTGGLDSAEEPVIKETRPKTGGLSIAGTKGVSLEPENSLEVRNRLLELIRQRESERSGFGALLEKLAVYSPSQNTSLNERMSGYAEKQRQRDQDIFNMQLGVSQLDTEEKRLAQARAKALQNRNQFGSTLTGGANAPATGQVASPQEVQSFARGLNQTQATALMMLYDQNPVEATKQMLALTKDTDLQRNLRSAGVQEGSDAWNNAILASTLPGAGGTEQIPDPNNPGFFKTVPKTEAIRSNIGVSTPPKTVGPLTAVPEEQERSIYDRLTAPVPTSAPTAIRTTAPTTRTIVPTATATAPTTSTAPAQRFTSPAAQSVMNTANPYPKTDIANYGKFEEEKQKKALELETESKKVDIEGRKTEAQDLGKASAADQVVHSDNVKMAPANALISKQLETDINAVPGLLGKLNKPTIFSTIMNLADKGVQVGNLGSVSIPGLKDAIVQLDPEVRKDPKKLEAYQRVINNISKIGLEFARAVNKGMGSMSNYERSIVEQAVGDPTRMNANNLMMKAKALECDAKNAMEKDKLWNQMQKAGYDWTKFKKSPEYIDMERKQFYRTAKAMRLPDAKFPGDQ